MRTRRLRRPNRDRIADRGARHRRADAYAAADHYVFCYACGVRLVDFQVLRWDGAKMVAEGWEPQLTGYITRTTSAAFALKPDLAAAYFLRGWAARLIDPGNPEVLADVERVAQLDPMDALFSESAAYLKK